MEHREYLRLRGHRQRSGLTQDDLALLLDLKKGSCVCRFERGVREPYVGRAFEYEALLQVEVGELFPALKAEAYRSVAKRVDGLVKELEKREGDRRDSYKLKRLVDLREEILEQSKRV